MIGRPLADGVEPPVETPLADAESDIYPCMLAICGSGFGWMQVCSINNYLTIVTADQTLEVELLF
jgi:hypothetical protein